MLLNNSHAGAADYARWLDLPEDAIRVIHNGFHLPAELAPSARDEVRAELGVPADAFVVGSITRFSEEKRPQLFIDMARVLAASHPRLRFVVFGNGVKLEEMRAYVASAGLGGVVRLPGLTDNAWRSLAAMDVFVLTSRFEGLPNVLVEAQASGLPIVCTGVGGMVETFVEGETGYSVPAATPEALADAVARLADDPALRARMSDRAFRHARAAFGIETMLDQTARAYDDQYARDALRLRQELATVHPPALHGGALAAGEGRHPGIRGP
jgi:glycosyltransferase involved in cell wall biosynthesis